MAPTEILAAQHAETLAPMLDKLGISCTLLTGSMTAAAETCGTGRHRDRCGAGGRGHARAHSAGCAVPPAGAVIADEQHRFGVAQRAALSAKGGSPHVLVMSATPIPRTLALIMYGDLDVSVLDEIPPGRSPVETYAVGENMRKRITAFIDKQVGLGGQAYVVCPLIEDSENAEIKLKSAEQHAKDLQKLLPHRRVAVLHGRMKNAEKDQIMRDFAAQKYDILVATTVIEVGVDVPNANLMVVEDADRVRSVAAAPAARTCRPRYTAVVLCVLRRGQRDRSRGSACASCAGPATASRSHAQTSRSAVRVTFRSAAARSARTARCGFSG